MRHALYTDVTIEAPPEVVWDELTDPDRYREWNPCIVEAAAIGSTRLVHTEL